MKDALALCDRQTRARILKWRHARRWRAEHPERVAANNRSRGDKYRESHNRRRRERGKAGAYATDYARRIARDPNYFRRRRQ